LFTTNPDEAVTLSRDRAKTEALIESLELEWLAALEAYDQAREREGLDEQK